MIARNSRSCWSPWESTKDPLWSSWSPFVIARNSRSCRSSRDSPKDSPWGSWSPSGIGRKYRNCWSFEESPKDPLGLLESCGSARNSRSCWSSSSRESPKDPPGAPRALLDLPGTPGATGAPGLHCHTYSYSASTSSKAPHFQITRSPERDITKHGKALALHSSQLQNSGGHDSAQQQLYQSQNRHIARSPNPQPLDIASSLKTFNCGPQSFLMLDTNRCARRHL